MNLKEFLEHHSQEQLANMIRAEGGTVTQGAISHWLVKGKIPAERVLQLERVSGGKMTRHELRPDLYPRDDAA